VNWVDTDDVIATAYDSGVPGHELSSVATLRLWTARATSGINLDAFNKGDYMRAVEAKNQSENVSRVLYPDDSTDHGKELRLRQEYFFVSASLQDIVRRYLKNPRQLRPAGRQGGHSPERHPPRTGRARADAPAGRRARTGMGLCLGAVPAHLQLHQPHADAARRWRPGQWT
jgi:starch phosphorylase